MRMVGSSLSGEGFLHTGAEGDRDDALGHR